MDITLLTEQAYIAPQKRNWYLNNILKEDGLVQAALEQEGMVVQRKAWDDPEVDWSQTKAALFRTTWDYFNRFPVFFDWMERTKKQTNFLNPYELIKWNVDKHYLADLQQNGISIPPTRFIEKGSTASLARLLEDTGWQDAILKPAISGTARHTYRINSGNSANHENIFQRLLAEERFLLQSFQTSVPKHGELSLVVIGGQFTHAVLKKAKGGDFRVQDDFGGTVHAYQATTEEVAFAERAVAACQPQPLYARVDLVRDNDGQLALMELELIEPELWFRMNEEAATLLARTIAREINES